MQLDRKSLAFGQLPSTKGDLYSPATGNKGLVHNVVFHNTNTSAETVELYYHDGTNEYLVLKQSIDADDTFIWDFRGAGDVIEDGAKLTGNTTTAAKVTYKFSGTEETPSAAAASGGAAAGGAESNLWATPTAGHASDDEFDGTDMASWAVQNITDATTGSITLDAVDAYDTTFNIGDAVRVNLGDRESWARIQAPARTKRYLFHKTLTFPTNLLMVARFKLALRYQHSNDGGEFAIFFAENTAGVPTTNKRVILYGSNTFSGTNRPVTTVVKSGGSSTDGIVPDGYTDGLAYPYEYVALHKVGSDYHFWVGVNQGAWVHLHTANSNVDFSVDSVGFHVQNVSTAAPGVPVIGIDYLRFYETADFIL